MEDKQEDNVTRSIWRLEANPLYSVECPDCSRVMFMSREPLTTRLKKWAKMIKKI